jgi:hypothetical protein
MLKTQINLLLQPLKNWGRLSSERLRSKALGAFNIRRWLLISTLLLVGCSGCASLSGLSSKLSQNWSPALEFRMNPVQSGDRAGLYTVSGQTTLPNKTQVTVSAIRQLQDAATVDGLPSYALLDRQFAQVSQGGWKADLNIWQTAPNGKLQESWQSSLKDFSVKSLPEVIFLATIDPPQQPANLQSQLNRLDVSEQLGLVRFTPDGEQYLQISQTLKVAPPIWTPTTAKASDRVPRAVPVVRSNPSTDWQQIPLPLSPDEFLR